MVVYITYASFIYAKQNFPISHFQYLKVNYTNIQNSLRHPRLVQPSLRCNSRSQIFSSGANEALGVSGGQDKLRLVGHSYHCWDHDPAMMKYLDCTPSRLHTAFDSNVIYQIEIMEYVLLPHLQYDVSIIGHCRITFTNQLKED
ncbi:hypothetical protein YC2023_109705 [Brassica napus]